MTHSRSQKQSQGRKLRSGMGMRGEEASSDAASMTATASESHGSSMPATTPAPGDSATAAREDTGSAGAAKNAAIAAGRWEPRGLYERLKGLQATMMGEHEAAREWEGRGRRLAGIETEEQEIPTSATGSGGSAPDPAGSITGAAGSAGSAGSTIADPASAAAGDTGIPPLGSNSDGSSSDSNGSGNSSGSGVSKQVTPNAHPPTSSSQDSGKKSSSISGGNGSGSINSSSAFNMTELLRYRSSLKPDAIVGKGEGQFRSVQVSAQHSIPPGLV